MSLITLILFLSTFEKENLVARSLQYVPASTMFFTLSLLRRSKLMSQSHETSLVKYFLLTASTIIKTSLYNVYNLLAAFTVVSITGVDGNTIAKSQSNYVLKNFRVVTFTLGNRKGTLVTSKHENSISYNQSLKLAASDKESAMF